jgi:hypothetical protein
MEGKIALLIHGIPAFEALAHLPPRSLLLLRPIQRMEHASKLRTRARVRLRAMIICMSTRTPLHKMQSTSTSSSDVTLASRFERGRECASVNVGPTIATSPPLPRGGTSDVAARWQMVLRVYACSWIGGLRHTRTGPSISVHTCASLGREHAQIESCAIENAGGTMIMLSRKVQSESLCMELRPSLSQACWTVTTSSGSRRRSQRV